MSGPVHCCPTSRKWTPKPKLNKKRQDCLVVSNPVKNRPRDIFEIADFPEKVYLCALDQDCTSNFLVQCCLNRIWKALTRLRTVGKHFLHCAGNCFAYAGRPRQQCVVYFPAKHVCARQHCRLFSWAKVFMGLGKHCTGNFLVQCWHRQI